MVQLSSREPLNVPGWQSVQETARPAENLPASHALHEMAPRSVPSVLKPSELEGVCWWWGVFLGESSG